MEKAHRKVYIRIVHVTISNFLQNRKETKHKYFRNLVNEMHAEVYNVCNLLRNVFKGKKKRIGGWPEKCTGWHVPKQIQYVSTAASRCEHMCVLYPVLLQN